MTQTAAGTATHQATCLRCGRRLSDPKAIARGYGRTCSRRIAAAAQASTDKPAQVAKAVELIETGGIVAIHKGRAFRVVASNGVDQYLCGQGNCSCPAGLHGRRCYHLLAVSFVADTIATTAPPAPKTDPFACFARVDVDPFADAA